MRPDLAGRLNAAQLWNAERNDEQRCQAEPWPFGWTPPGPRPGTEAEEDRRHDVRMAIVAQERARMRLDLATHQASWLARQRSRGWLT